MQLLQHDLVSVYYDNRLTFTCAICFDRVMLTWLASPWPSQTTADDAAVYRACTVPPTWTPTTPTAIPICFKVRRTTCIWVTLGMNTNRIWWNITIGRYQGGFCMKSYKQYCLLTLFTCDSGACCSCIYSTLWYLVTDCFHACLSSTLYTWSKYSLPFLN